MTTKKSRKSAEKTPRTNRTPKKVPTVAEPAGALTHSDADKARALVAYRIAGTIKSACEAAQIARSTWYEWRQSDAAFDRLARDAEDDVADNLEAIAVARATAKESPSDTLLIFLLKSLRRERFGDKQTVTVIHPDVLDRLRRQAAIIQSREVWPRDELFAAIEGVWN
jgi:hypothetical protein